MINMDPENVAVTFSIVVANNTHRNHAKFSEEWNFTTGRYVFNRISEDEVRVSFTFDAVLKKYDEDHQLVDECPSEYLPEYQEYEEEIEVILDLLSLEIGSGLQIKEESFLFASTTCRDNEFKNSRLIVPSKTRELYPQFAIEENRGLGLALRLYRQSVSVNDPREQMVKLFAALEQLFYNKGKRMLTKEEIIQVRGAIDALPLPPEKRKIILDRVCDIRKSPKTMIIENLDLMNGDELISEEEKKQLIGTWNKYRSVITHGELISRRDEGFDYVVSQIDTIVESILRRSIEHRMREGGRN